MDCDELGWTLAPNIAFKVGCGLGLGLDSALATLSF